MTVIKLEHLTKIEGHASLTVKIDEGKVQKVELAVVEGARFIEGIIKGRRFDEVHLVVQRICGICSVSHTLACLKAIENALGIVPSNQTKMLRELMEIGAHIQSHSLHLYLLALPDYLGYGRALEMAGKYRKEVVRGLGLKKLGNEIDAVIGGRVMHPVTPCIGGFRALPEQGRLEALQRQLDLQLTQVVQARALDHQRGSAPVAVFALDGAGAQLPAQVAGGQSVARGQQLAQRSLVDDVAAVVARAGSQLDEMLGAPQHVQVVLDHDDRVTARDQAFQGRDQAIAVGGVQAAGGLVQNV